MFCLFLLIWFPHSFSFFPLNYHKITCTWWLRATWIPFSDHDFSFLPLRRHVIRMSNSYWTIEHKSQNEAFFFSMPVQKRVCALIACETTSSNAWIGVCFDFVILFYSSVYSYSRTHKSTQSHCWCVTKIYKRMEIMWKNGDTIVCKMC